MVRTWAACLAILVALMVGAAAYGQSVAPLSLNPGQNSPAVKSHLRYLDNAPAGPLETLDPALLRRFRPVDHASTQFGQVGDDILVFLNVRNTGVTTGTWIISSGRGSLTRFRLYQLRGGELDLLLDNADAAQTKRVLYEYQSFAREFQLSPGERTGFLFQFRDENSSWMPISVQPFGSFFAERRANIALVSAVVFGSLILIFFNVVMYRVTGKPEFFWLGGAELAFALNTLHAEGYTTIFLLHDQPAFSAVLGEMTRTAFALLMLQFGRVFLDTRHAFPRYDRPLRAAIGLGVLVIVAALIAAAVPTIPRMPLHAAGWLYIMITSMLLPVLAVMAMRRHGRVFWPLFVSWISVALYITYSAVAISGIAPGLPVNWHLIGPVGLFECAMATLALGLHLRQIQQGRVDADQRIRIVLLEKLALSNEASQLAESRARAQASARDRETLIRMSGHDTRHVLHALNSAVHHYSRKGKGHSSSAELTKLIEASARHLDEIVATTVSTSAGDGRFVALAAIDLQRVMDDLAAIYGPIADHSGLELRFACGQQAVAICDEALISRALSNLINNALKCGGSGTVDVRCDRTGDCLQLAVADQGPGMPPAVVAALADPAAVRRGDVPAAVLGTGWLAICDMMELLGGSYALDKGPVGTTATLTLPHALAPDSEQPVTTEQLAERERDFAFVDLEDPGASEAAQRIACDGTGRTLVLIAREATSAIRIGAAGLSPLALISPLYPQMLAHPRFAKLQSIPAR